MSETKRIKDQLSRAFDGEAWHGPSVFEVLAGVTAEQAAAHPVVEERPESVEAQPRSPGRGYDPSR